MVSSSCHPHRGKGAHTQCHAHPTAPVTTPPRPLHTAVHIPCPINVMIISYGPSIITITPCDIHSAIHLHNTFIPANVIYTAPRSASPHATVGWLPTSPPPSSIHPPTDEVVLKWSVDEVEHHDVVLPTRDPTFLKQKPPVCGVVHMRHPLEEELIANERRTFDRHCQRFNFLLEKMRLPS